MQLVLGEGDKVAVLLGQALPETLLVLLAQTFGLALELSFAQQEDLLLGEQLRLLLVPDGDPFFLLGVMTLDLRDVSRLQVAAPEPFRRPAQRRLGLERSLQSSARHFWFD